MSANPRWVIARVMEQAIRPPKSQEHLPVSVTQPIYTVRFRLLEPINFEGKRYRSIWASFSTKEIAVYRIAEFLRGVECPIPPTSLSLPDNRLQHRYCRLGIMPIEYENRRFLSVRHFATINQPFVIPPAEMVNEGLRQLGITAHIEKGNLVITPPPEPAEEVEDE